MVSAQGSRVRVVAGLTFALSLTACGDDSRPGALGDDSDDDFAGGCNVALAACRASVFAEAASVRGQEGAVMPPVRTITLGEFADELSEELDAAEPDPWAPALTLLGLLDPEQSSGEAEVQTLLEGVAAYYDTRTQAVTLISRGGGGGLDDVFVLAHEFVHALQDADFGLQAFRAEWATSTDSLVATKCLTEGEATVLGFGVIARALGVPAGQLEWTDATETMLASILADVAGQPSTLYYAAQSLPYPLGLAGLGQLWLSEGQPALDALYETPVLAVADWAGGRLQGDSLVEPLDCYPTQGPPGFSATDHDALGAAGVFALVAAEGASGEDAWAVARSTRNDSVVVFQDDAAPGSHAVAWRLRVPDADAFAKELDPGPNLRVEVHGTEVLIVGATDAAALSAWTNAARCGTREELPLSPEGSGPAASAARRRVFTSGG